MARLTAEEVAAKWARNTGQASQDYAQGVERVSEAPGARAAAKVDKWRQGLVASEGKWKSRVASVSAEEWKQAVRDKGVSRYAAGAAAAEPKMAAFQRDFLPFLDSVTARVRSMPDTTPEDRINRMVAQVRGVAGYKRR